ncbi:sugar transferase [Flavobacteriaceae bacterium 14752]|uniref:sugar transferase n=1 Tax=Mesohalobacter salilacus TaxID=2491711 RepID=UPI000F63A03A|nr:sugar transferase [Flavobacteriaceae bacterium 14752]
MSIFLNQRLLKRLFDFLLAILGLVCFLPVLLLLLVITSINTNSFGLIAQTRIGKDAKPFKLLKFKTMKDTQEISHHITTSNDPRITTFGRFLRKTKLDELPQLWNVLLGDMSLVGPRPDVPGYADQLQGEDRIILSVRPGITGPASLAFRNEENILTQQKHPKQYNDEVIWPKKVEINKAYVNNYSFKKDMHYILQTIFG